MKAFITKKKERIAAQIYNCQFKENLSKIQEIREGANHKRNIVKKV